jgi:3-methylcrotonyl-CoA carboxylase beta subunit
VAALESLIDPKSKEFQANAAQMRELVEELNRRRAEAALGGNEKTRERHIKRG